MLVKMLFIEFTSDDSKRFLCGFRNLVAQYITLFIQTLGACVQSSAFPGKS